MSFSQPQPGSDPLALFQGWFRAVEAAGVPMPEAMTLATATADGRPSARMVLLKGFTADGRPRFFTNYDSRKGRVLADNPRAALLFFWHGPNRQVRIEGPVQRLGPAESDAYFASRPRLSQLGSAVSPQSRPISGHDALLREVDALAAALGDAPVPRPAHWGGFAVEPETWEFWIGHDGRLHERYQYTRGAAGWDFAELAP